MFKLQIDILCACILLVFHGSAVESQDYMRTEYNQCDQFCLAQISQIQNKLNTIEGRLSDKETEKQIKLDAQLLQRELDLLNESSKKIITQEDFEAALQRKTEEIQSKMESDILALEKRFESKMQILQARLEDQGIQDRSKNLPDKFSENSSKILNEEYVLIGGKYYFIERNIKLDHNAAAKKCCQRGGYLVTIQSEEELNSLQGKLKFNDEYWVDSNNQNKKNSWGTFVSWSKKKIGLQDCCYVKNKAFYESSCSKEMFFICQYH